MIKSRELKNKESCFNKALNSEYIFVLLARDKAAPVVIRAWVGERLRIGKNRLHDGEIQDALLAAKIMEEQQRGIHKASKEREKPVGEFFHD